MATIFMLDLARSHKESFVNLLGKLITAAEGTKILKVKRPCAIKMHFGEDGNVNFINPLYVRKIAGMIRTAGSNPFLIDTTTLYSGRRFRADTHIELAREHGFDFAPAIIADGLYGDEFYEQNGLKFGRAFSGIDTAFIVSHFKGHMMTGFGAAIKNIGMGCASKGGKLKIHSHSKPQVVAEKCTSCLKCCDYCAFQAITPADNTVSIDPGKCTGCCGCMTICPEHAIKFSWSANASEVQKGIAAYTSAFVKKRDLFYLNFLVNISPECDCFHSNEPLISPDIGVLAGYDPVAIDQAAYDLTKDKIDKLHPEVDPQEQLYFAEQFGAGERKYEIKKI